MKKAVLLISLTFLALALYSCWIKESSNTINYEIDNKPDVWFDLWEDWWGWDGDWNDWWRN